MSKFPRVKTQRGFIGTGAVLKNQQKNKSTETLLKEFETNLKEFNQNRNIREREDYAFKILDLAKIQMRELETRGIEVSIFAN